MNIKKQITNLFYMFRTRTYDKYHIVRTELKPGYYEIDTRMLYANFALLKIYVEVQCASMEFMFQKNSWFDSLKYKFCRWKSTELGLKHLKWEMNPDNSNQYLIAAEVVALYDWWTNIRPNRKDIDFNRQNEIDEVDIEEILSGKFKNDNPELYKDYFENISDNHKLDEKWHEEDTEMLIRLIKIRRTLWI